ncbi:MAG: hypothetical protein R2750_04595 [Bacteroidales bacterium]
MTGGTYTYYVTAVYDSEESLPSNIATVVILLSPQNLAAMADGEGNIVLNWDPVGEVVVGDLIELTQHDGIRLTPSTNFSIMVMGWFTIYQPTLMPPLKW